MKKPFDSWCSSVISRHGNRVSGGAARAVRIADLGGVDQIIEDVSRDTLARANEVAAKRSRSKLRLVSNG